jgi:hypothetical protein
MTCFNYLSVKASCACERFSGVSCDSDILAGLYLPDFIWKVNGILLVTSQSQGVGILTGFEAKGNNTHSYQITAMNSLKTFGYHSFDSLSKKKMTSDMSGILVSQMY